MNQTESRNAVAPQPAATPIPASVTRDITISDDRLYAVPASYARTLKPNELAVAYGIARKLQAQKRIHNKAKAGSKGTKYVLDGSPAISFPIGDRNRGEELAGNYLSNDYPWMNSDTYRRCVNKLKKKGIVQVHEGELRHSTKQGRIVRTPNWYTMQDETIKQILDGRQLLHFSVADAVRFGNVMDALVLNKVQTLFELQRRDNPEKDTLILTPGMLEKELKFKETTIRASLSRIVARGVLERGKGDKDVIAKNYGTSSYRLLEPNPLRHKTLKGTIERVFQPLEGVSPAVEKLALAQMQDDVRYWFQHFTKGVAGPHQDIHFKKAAAICHFNHYNPYHFVSENLGSGKLNKEAAFLHGINAEQKYLGWNGDHCFGGQLQNARESLRDDLKYRSGLYNRYRRNNPDLTIEDVLLDDGVNLPAWFRLFICPPDNCILPELQKRYGDEARREVQKRSCKFMEALCEVEADAYFPKNIFPYYKRYFEYGPPVKAAAREKQAEETVVTSVTAMSTIDDVLDQACSTAAGHSWINRRGEVCTVQMDGTLHVEKRVEVALAA